METFERLESAVRSYSRAWPVVFATARGHQLFDEAGHTYIDFFSGAGTLNYGHNPPALKQALIDYLESDGVTHGLDMATVAKRACLERFDELILRPRDLQYRIQFPGPTGTNAVEAALKVARKATGRSLVISFSHGFHGMTLGSLAVSANEWKRAAGGVPLAHARSMPFDGQLGENVDTTTEIETFLESEEGRADPPAAVIVETVQGEGGLHAASFEWLQRVRSLCDRFGMLLIVDDIQVGCGRTGPFFSFEPAAIVPDIVCLSKSISGYGLPMALVLIRPQFDVWEPGEHSGTFRGNNPAFVTATKALDYWTNDEFACRTMAKSEIVTAALRSLADAHPAARASLRGRGMIQGLHSPVPGLAGAAATAAFERGLVLETSGPDADVIKLLPPLTISDDALEEGLAVLATAWRTALEAID